MTARDDRADQLHAALQAQPEMTYLDGMVQFGWRRNVWYGVVRDLRLKLADSDTNVMADPAGKGEPWRYRLAHGQAALHRSETRWPQYAMDAAETRLVTIHAVASTAVQATNGRTKDGKRARMMEVGVRHLVENLAALDD